MDIACPITKKIFSIDSILQRSTPDLTNESPVDFDKFAYPVISKVESDDGIRHQHIPMEQPHLRYHQPYPTSNYHSDNYDSDNHLLHIAIRHPHHHPATTLPAMTYKWLNHKSHMMEIEQVQPLPPKTNGRRLRRSAMDRKPRQAYSSRQLDKLESEFNLDKYLSVSKRMELSRGLSLTEVQIKTWFQNRRTKWKKQMTAKMKMAQRQSLWSSVSNGSSTAFYPSGEDPNFGHSHSTSATIYQSYLTPQHHHPFFHHHQSLLADPIAIVHHPPTSINYFLQANSQTAKTK